MESTINVIKEHGKSMYQCNQRTWKESTTINVIKEHGKYYQCNQCNQRTWKVLSM